MRIQVLRKRPAMDVVVDTDESEIWIFQGDQRSPNEVGIYIYPEDVDALVSALLEAKSHLDEAGQ